MERIRRVAGQLLPMMKNSRGKDSKPLVQQMVEIGLLQMRRQLSPYQYYDYQLYRKGTPGLWQNDYLGRYLYHDLQDRLNRQDWNAISINKWLFYTHMKAFGLPLPTAYGYYDVINGTTVFGQSLRSAGDLQSLLDSAGLEEFVVKPVRGGKGRDVQVLRRISSTDLVSLSGQELTVSDLAARMADKPFIVQARVRQHADMDRINPHNLNTVRTMTYVDAQGAPHIHFAYLRMGRKGSNTDNTHGGGVFAHIDLQSGVLGEAAYLDTQPYLRAHPDTGYEFAGKQVPGWDEVRNLSLQAARLSPLAYAGWDIALSEGGPVLIELNTRWAYRAMQKCRPYLTPEIRRQFAERGL